MITQDIDRKLFLLDAYALIYRAYFAFAKNPRINSKGQNTSAAFGFTNALIDIIRTEKPTHMAVVFDPPGGAGNRTADFAEYKAHREEMPEDIRSMIEPIKKILEAFCVPMLMVDGYEADDVIGTLAKMAEKEGYVTYMMTPDKDFGQLVSDKIFIYKPGRMGNPPEILGVPEVCAKFGVDDPLKVIDILGLWGDAVDNIPGIPGIGEKTSKILIEKYGSVEGLIEHAHELKGKQQENVINFAEQGILSKLLATIILDVDVVFHEEDFEMCEPNPDMIREIFTELEFRNLSKRVLGEEIVITANQNATSLNKMEQNGQLNLFGTPDLSSNQEVMTSEELKTLESVKHNYNLVDTQEKRADLINKLSKAKEFCFDTETTSLDALHADIVGLAISMEVGTAYYVSFPNDFDASKKILEEFQEIFAGKSLKIAHNLKYDLQVLSRYGIVISDECFDTMVAHYIINPESKQSMDFLAEFYLKYKTISIETLIGKKGKGQGNMGDLEPAAIVDYACEDADITLQLKHVFEPEISKDHLVKLFYEVEMPLIRVLQEIEKEGIAIDVEGLNKYSAQMNDEMLILEKEIKELAGMDFNVDSPKQLGEILFDVLKISAKAKKTKTGQYATAEDVLEKHKEDHAIVPKILDYRKLKKLKSTYVDPLPTMTDAIDGRVHSSFMQTVTATGRLSSNNPNLQNIPIRSEKGKEIRKSFIPRSKDFQLMAADYSQIELRIIAALSDDKAMIEAFKSGIDIHTATASKVFATPLEEVTRDQRSAAKAVNFGIIYGQSAFGLSQNLKISRTEAKNIIDNYFAQYPSLKKYMDNVVNDARENGFVETIMKRRRYLPDLMSSNAVVRGFAERNAVNAPIQGSAADIIKMAMIEVSKAIKKAKLQSKMILQVHDELVFDVHKDEIDAMKSLVKRAMEEAIELVVPMQVEMEVGDNWLDAH